MVVTFNNVYISSCNIELISIWSYNSLFCSTEIYTADIFEHLSTFIKLYAERTYGCLEQEGGFDYIGI